jgi:cytochrome P450
MLHNNPRAKNALLEEIDSVGINSLDKHISYEDIKLMKYAKAVFYETLRLYPPVSFEVKQCNTNDVLPNGILINKGEFVAWSIYAMGRSTRIWGADALEYRPERWLSMTTLPSPYEFPVFNAGPRMCLGKNMAELEGVFVLVSLMRKFNIDVIYPEKVTYAQSLTLPMKDGLKCRITCRCV